VARYVGASRNSDPEEVMLIDVLTDITDDHEVPDTFVNVLIIFTQI
jgi:hypothetical protein